MAGRSEITVGKALAEFLGSGGVPPAGAPASGGKVGELDAAIVVTAALVPAGE